MAKRKRTDPAKDFCGQNESDDQPIDPATQESSSKDALDERHLNKTSRSNESDELESRHLARSRSRNFDGASRMSGYKSGDGSAPGATNEERSNQGSDDRKLNSDQSLEEGSTTTGKRLEKDDELDDA